MKWWRRRPAQVVVEHTWYEPVDSSDTDAPFVVRLHMSVRTDERRTPDPAGSSDAVDGATIQHYGSPGPWAAAMWVREEVEKITSRWSVLHRQRAQHELNNHLTRILADGGGATVTAVTAFLSVPQDSLHAVNRLLELHREERLNDLARRQVATNMRFLREECFDNPASARLFLMLNASPRLGVFPSADQADELVAEVNRWHPENLWVQVAKTLHSALGSVTASQADEMLRVLAALLHGTGHPNEASELARLCEELPDADGE